MIFKAILSSHRESTAFWLSNHVYIPMVATFLHAKKMHSKRVVPATPGILSIFILLSELENEIVTVVVEQSRPNFSH